MSENFTGDHDVRTSSAFRAAVADVRTSGLVNPAAARRTAVRRRSVGIVAGCAAVVAMLVGVLGVFPHLSDYTRVVPAVGDPTAAPAGWRLEYYRDITFQVPTSWTYAEEPIGACGWNPFIPSDPIKAHYVALGHHTLDTLMKCDRENKDALLTEHAATNDVDGAGLTSIERVRGRWVQNAVVGGVQLKAVSRNRRTAERIIATASVRTDDSDRFCRPHSVVEKQVRVRAAQPFDIRSIDSVTAITLCQYDADDTAYPSGGGLLARTELTGAAAGQLLAQLKGASPAPARRCFGPTSPAASVDVEVSFALELRLHTDTGAHDLLLRTGFCSDPRRTPFGGADDGTTLRTVTVMTCKAMLTGPIAYWTTTNGVDEACER